MRLEANGNKSIGAGRVVSPKLKNGSKFNINDASLRWTDLLSIAQAFST